jgi:hypothetical protein
MCHCKLPVVHPVLLSSVLFVFYRFAYVFALDNKVKEAEGEREARVG